MTNENRARYGRDAIAKGTPDYAENDGRTNAVDTIANVDSLRPSGDWAGVAAPR